MSRKPQKEPVQEQTIVIDPKPASLLTRPLGLEGWTALEPVLLGALVSEEPLLLIGRHGSAKSFLLERLAQALRLDYRFYNASLVNFDDLVGIPVPDESQRSLRYIATPSAIWDAEVVFIDEINRTKPELQNKLFPIIHERRVQGQRLERLRYRWAAMNPPPRLDAADEEEDVYIGAEPLDPALADRFAFLITVPTWQDLTEAEKRAVLADQFSGEHAFPMDPSALVAEARAVYEEFCSHPPTGLHDYLICIEQLLRNARLQLSARRVTILHRNILAVQAARVSLAKRAADESTKPETGWNESALLALRHSLPQLAQTGNLDQTAILAAHRQAWAVAGLDKNDPWRELLQEGDPIRRLTRALQFGVRIVDMDVGRLILEAVAAQPLESHRVAVSLVAYLAVHKDRAIPGSVVETLAREVQRVLQPREETKLVYTVTVGAHREVGLLCASLTDSLRDRYTRNLLNGLLSDGYRGTSPQEVKIFFDDLWERLAFVLETTSQNTAASE